jgi:hypothetical protein
MRAVVPFRDCFEDDGCVDEPGDHDSHDEEEEEWSHDL